MARNVCYYNFNFEDLKLMVHLQEELLKELLIERKARVETEDASRRSAQIEMNNFANEHQDLTNKYNLLNEKFEQQTATIQALLERNTEEQSQIQATIRGLGQVPFDSDATPATVRALFQKEFHPCSFSSRQFHGVLI